jgi:hypothetical protein
MRPGPGTRTVATIAAPPVLIAPSVNAFDGPDGEPGASLACCPFASGTGNPPPLAAGVTPPLGVDAPDPPCALVATTVNVYGTPSVSPVTVHEVVAVVVHVAPPGPAVTA